MDEDTNNQEEAAQIVSRQEKDVEDLQLYLKFLHQLLINLNEVQERYESSVDGKAVECSA
jgi:hypothetical protein